MTAYQTVDAPREGYGYSHRDTLINLPEQGPMVKTVTPQELQVLRNIPSANSGSTVAISELAENLRASGHAMKIILSRLHRKQLIAMDEPHFSDRSSMCFRTETGDRAVTKRYR